ncbi:MAG: hypothetical protein Q8S73_37230 [Deltaproteobacteria bacterium]|nr:hypothetical protein [Myxococcales bacterium]MDP3219805.1 hypothetical protein [Deltaproteobacteria bacterium]
MKTTRALAWACLAVVALVGCGSPDPTEAENDGLDTGGLDFSTEEIRSTGSPPWVYGGSLPLLVSPKVVVSQSGHTVRVTGDLPEAWSGVVPYYASVEMTGARRVLTVVYPIATGASASLDSAARTFNTVSGIPFRPNGMAYPTTGPAYVTWGGFPFVAYNGGIAFHGPISYTTSTAGGERVYDWYLQRGPVSHGCNRMQGEHVVEFAHLIGFDMHNTWGANVRVGRRATVQVIRDYDRLSTGEAVDVDYPRWTGARAPTGPTRVFPTWNADEMPRLVCADNRATRRSNTRVPDGFCDYMPSNGRDLATGNPIGPVLVDNGTTAFRASTSFARYTRSPVRVGADYMAAEIATAGTATWTLPVTRSGRFRLWARYAPDENRNTRASYRAYSDATDASGQSPVVVNQRQPGTQGWVELGVYSLNPGAKVVLSAASSSDGWTIADAVRLEPAS